MVRQEQEQLRRYVHLSTGNYNVGTARLYTDVGLFTADQDLGEDVSELFNALSGFSKIARYRKLAVAPRRPWRKRSCGRSTSRPSAPARQARRASSPS